MCKAPEGRHPRHIATPTKANCDNECRGFRTLCAITWKVLVSRTRPTATHYNPLLPTTAHNHPLPPVATHHRQHTMLIRYQPTITALTVFFNQIYTDIRAAEVGRLCWRRQKPWTGARHHKQYAQPDYDKDVNVFISSGDHVKEHWERRSWKFSLMRLMELYGNDLSPEIIHGVLHKLEGHSEEALAVMSTFICAPTPNPWTGARHHKQYAQSDYDKDVFGSLDRSAIHI